MLGSKAILAQQVQEQKGEHKSVSLCPLWLESWEIEVDWLTSIVPSSTQGSADKENIIIDNIIATSFIEFAKIRKY